MVWCRRQSMIICHTSEDNTEAEAAQLHHPFMERACLLLDGEVEKLKLSFKVTLESQGETIKLFTPEDHLLRGLFCTKFQVPPPSTGSSEVATVRFQAQGDVDIMETKNVVIQRIDDAVVVQTDKATYKPGETVRFRIVTLDENFLCMKIKYYVVELKDPNNNRIAQWKDIDAKMCIADLSFNLTSDPMLGVYTISVENSQTLQTFIVEEQVLPRYEVTIEEPSKLFATQSTFPLKVCARYTYGKGVQGTVNVRLCRGTIYWFYWDRMPCTTVKGETDATGCLTTKVNATLLELSEVTMNFYTVEVSADFIEKATDIPFTVKKSVSVSVDSVAITYEEMGTYYRRGQPFRIIMLVKDQNGSPLPFESVILNIYYGDNGFMKKDGLTGNDGRVTFTLETSQWSETVYIRPNIKDVDLSQTEVLPFYTEANSFLRFEPIREVIPCEGKVEVRVEYSLDQQDLSKGTKSVALYYVVIGKGGILVHGVKSINLVALQGHLSIGIHFQPKFGTAPKMLGFLILQNGTVVADRINFKMGMCFPNQASLKFARQTASPKSQISLHLFSSVGSMCALRAVDKSVQINQESNELTPEKSQFADVFSLFKEIGVKILTNTQIAKPPVTEPCPLEMPFALPDKALPFQMLPSLTVSGSQNEVRKYFPDTWLWSLHKINGSHTTISVTVPDTITQFNARTFCIGDSGFGLSSEVSLTVFKPFFVDLLLPYSIVQGETLLLKALVFNYLKQCLKVHVNLLNSTDFSIQDCEDCLHTGCICADESEIFTWYIKANKIGSVPLTVKAEAINSVDSCRGHKVYVPPSGKLDILEKQLLVKPRGITKELTQNQFLCLNDSGETVKNLFPLTVPSSLVVGSESAYVAVMGDVLGSALQNLDGLIKMPYGCGEQNMLTMAPIVYVMDYLKATGQLSSSQSTQALLYLQSGYQRELNYKHIDGSYSAFGESDGEGSTWLTAFVMKCFYQAKNYIFIDDLVLNRAVMWLASRQKPDGCFTSSGRLFHTTMKGGVEDDLSLSTYITAALLERGTPGTVKCWLVSIERQLANSATGKARSKKRHLEPARPIFADDNENCEAFGGRYFADEGELLQGFDFSEDSRGDLDSCPGSPSDEDQWPPDDTEQLFSAVLETLHIVSPKAVKKKQGDLEWEKPNRLPSVTRGMDRRAIGRRREIEDIQQKSSALETKVATLDDSRADHETRLANLERLQEVHQQQMNEIWLQVDDHENRNRRNNLKIRGIPESVRSEALRSSATELFNSLLERPLGSELVIDRIHRTQQDPILNSSLSCIRASASSSSNPYTLALMAYTFALANDVKTKQMLLNKLYPLAASSDVDLYWPYTLQSSSSNDLSASVELTAYVLLALVTGSSPSKDDIQKASHIVTWLSKQQNPYGGFQSTQDTVVAIQALAKYTRVTFNPKASLSAMLFANEVYLKTFTVDQTNRLLLQKEPLPNIPGNYSMTVTGSGCVYIQVTYFVFIFIPVNLSKHSAEGAPD
ncbi:alpha-2-macroglobulin-like protein 1 [Gastrophryne carolinensis]